MKKKLFLRLFLMMGLLFLNSCRQDIIPEKETYNNSSAFQLTNKRISLSESRHKAKLLPELEQVENKFKALAKNNVQGKTVSFGNGVSIDTDNVIYIENGPNYHTYTFKINRENAPATAPVENLVLTPLPDGSYKEFLVSYDLTPQEKQEIANGHSVNLNNKTTITEITTGTNWGAQMKTTETFCYYTTYSEVKPCPCDGHTTLTGCTCTVKATSYTYINQVCEINEVDDTLTPLNPEGNTEGNGGGLTPESQPQPNDPPCDPSVPTSPQPGMTDPNGCPIGIPTIPDLGDPKADTPCTRAKRTTDLAKYKTNITFLEGKLGEDHEFGNRLGNPQPGTTQTGIQNDLLEGVPNTNVVNLAGNNYTFALMHSHFDNLYPLFSPQDIILFNDWIRGAIAYNNNPNNTTKININELSITVVTIYGNYLISFDGTTVDPYPNYTSEQLDDLVDDYKNYLKAANTNNGYNTDVMEREFLKFLNNKMPMPGLKLYKVESTSNTEIYLENGNRKIKKCL